MESYSPNGLSADSGEYLLPPLSPEMVSAAARGEPLDEQAIYELQRKLQERNVYAIEEGRNPRLLNESGWAVVFGADTPPAVREALEPLLERRRGQAGELFGCFDGPNALRPGESKLSYLARLPHRVGGGAGVGPGSVDPEKVPYYLLLVGSPTAIPFRVQQQLDVQYAVGRLHFETPQEYARYSSAVIAAETTDVRPANELGFFAVRNPDDAATAASADCLVEPLYEHASRFSDWRSRLWKGSEATKSALLDAMGGASKPAVLFTACHGLGFSLGDSRQRSEQGALVCQDWPGRMQWGPRAISADHYLSAADLPGDARLNGMMAFLFACYGGGTPRFDEFLRTPGGQRREITGADFVAPLPQRMLAQGALAVVGHVERAWGSSFLWPGVGAQRTVFESLLQALVEGSPIGLAMEHFNLRHAEISVDLVALINDIENGGPPQHEELADLWTANCDARNYVVLGDPAARLPTPRTPASSQLDPA